MTLTKQAARSMVGGFLLLAALGLALLLLRLGGSLERLSFDVLTVFGRKVRPEEVVLIYLDEASAQELKKAPDEPWPRALHTRLLERLTQDGARLVFYDILFDQPSADSAIDEAFANKMKAHRGVVLAGLYESTFRDGAREEIVTPPNPTLRAAAQSWGIGAFLPLDPDNAVRRMGASATEFPLATWLVAEAANAPVTKEPGARQRPRWLHYYGPSGTIGWCSFYQALEAGLIPPEFFRGKIVCIGSRPSPTARRFGVDEFANPYSRWTELFSPGLELQATMILNLLRGEWLTRLPLGAEVALILFTAALGAVAGGMLRPSVGLPLLATAAVVVFAGSLALHHWGHYWWNWLIPAAVQLPGAIVWSIGTRYLEEARRRAQLRQAFSLYLSPQMADRIANSEFDLKPGGELVEATVLFTDCQGFTSMSEELRDPKLISDTLIAYFTETSRHVLENDGTIIKYIGDAVFACWNAPLREPDHAAKAALAAWSIHEASQQVVLGRKLTTRVGVCTGEVLAGNLGSPYRFDYTALGETTNFASRLESLNKQLGTHILIADSTRRAIGDRFLARCLGHFVVAGKTTAVPIHELLAPAGREPAAREWLATWEAALSALRTGDFAELEKRLREVVWQRNGADGPSEFYLKQLARQQKGGELREWTGVVHLTEK